MTTQTINQFIGHLGGKNNCLIRHEDLGISLPRAVEPTNLQAAINDYLASDYIDGECYLTFSSSRKKAGKTYLGSVNYSSEYSPAGKFYAMCYFPDLAEVDFAITPDMIPEELWRTDTDSLQHKEFSLRNIVTDIIFMRQDGTVDIDHFETRPTFGDPYTICRTSVFNVKAFILVEDFMKWLSVGGEAVITAKLKAAKNAKHPRREMLNETISEIRTTTARYPTNDSLTPVIYDAGYSEGYSWCFAKSEIQTGDTMTLADGKTKVIVLYKMNADQLASEAA